MSDHENEKSLDEEAQKLKDMEATIAKLQAENQTLRSKPDLSNANQFVQNLTAGITEGISKAISTQAVKPKPSKSLKSEPAIVEVDPNLPQCFHDMQPKVKTDNVGPPISENISQLLERCWRYPFPKEDIIEILDKQVRPDNVNAVKPLEINSEVFNRMNHTDKQKDKDLRYIGNAICGAGKCLSYLMNMLAEAEIQMKSDYPDDEGWLVVDDFSFDFPKANKLMTNAMKILGIANVQTGQSRREHLKGKFFEPFKKLCNTSNGFEEGMFFGPSLDAATSLLNDENKLQNKTFDNKSAFRGRGQRRGRNRYSPYTPSQSSQLQAALLQHALAQQPQMHQQVSGVTTGGMFGINQFPQQPQPPSLLGMGIPSTVPHHRGRGRGHHRGYNKRRRGRGGRRM